MKIAITADPFIPVPPVLYGGIERIVELLCLELHERGHEVTLFAHRDSCVPGSVVSYPGDGGGAKATLLNMYTISRHIHSGGFDLIHSFGRLAYLLPLLPLKLPKLMSYQREPTLKQVKRAMAFAKKGSLAFTGCSNYITRQLGAAAPAYTVYNGVDMHKFRLSATVNPDAPLVFLGRIEPLKGTHTAIELALQTKRELVIAGNIAPGHETYFNERVKPFLGDQVRYIGPVDDQQKQQLLQRALALLMLIGWDEPFGIVMAEAMACGTPVLGLSRGAVPEVVTNGLTGYHSTSLAVLAGRLATVHLLDRTAVRQEAEKRFSGSVITNDYLRIYQEMMTGK